METMDGLRLRNRLRQTVPDDSDSDFSPNRLRTDKYFADDDEGSGNQTSCSEELPYDDSYLESRRKHKKKRGTRNLLRQAMKGTAAWKKEAFVRELMERQKSVLPQALNKEQGVSRNHPYDRKNGSSLIESSSETSPRTAADLNWTLNHPSKQMEPHTRHGRTLRRASLKTTKITTYANDNSDEEWGLDQSYETSYGKLNYDIQQDSSFIDLVNRYKWRSSKRHSSIASNFSDAPSECYSDFSIDLRDEHIAEQTFDRIAELEMEIGTLKSSVIEIDEEFFRYASRPNPYLIKSTFDDLLSDNSDFSRPSSALDVPMIDHTQDLQEEEDDYAESPMSEIGKELVDSGYAKSMLDSGMVESFSSFGLGGDAENISRGGSGFFINTTEEAHQETLEFVKNIYLQERHLPLKMQIYKMQTAGRRSSLKSMHLRASSVPANDIRKQASLEEPSPSLEWDNEALHQYEEEMKRKDVDVPKYDGNGELDMHQFLPDHSSLELDLEEELNQSPSLTVPSKFSHQKFASPTPPVYPSSPIPFPIVTPPTQTHERPSSLPLESTFLSFYDAHNSDQFYNDDLLNEKFYEDDNIESSLTCFNENIPMKGGANLLKGDMTTSIDSAIHSGPASRSGSSSPMRSLSNSMMSSGLGASWSEASPSGIDSFSENSWFGNERGKRLNPFADDTIDSKSSRLRSRSSSVDEEDEENLLRGHLSPVQELREKDSSQSCHSTPEHHSQYRNYDFDEVNVQLKDTYNNNLNIMGNSHARANARREHGLDNISSIDENNSIARGLSTSSKTDAIGEKIEIISYSQLEWHGNTTKAQTIKKGYSAIPGTLGLNHIRNIRGDNYCGIRAAAFQVLSSGISVPSGYQTYNRLLQEIKHSGNSSSSWLREYSFGKRLSYSKDRITDGFKDCLDALDRISLELESCENRSKVVLQRLNEDPHLDLLICEAVKLHMLSAALDLFTSVECEENVPIFAFIMYARESCANPTELMKNHLNLVGDSAGLEQDNHKVEMFLLGHALQVTLRVARPSCYGNEDFISYYPDDNVGHWPEVTLIAEDDRHYNVLVT